MGGNKSITHRNLRIEYDLQTDGSAERANILDMKQTTSLCPFCYSEIPARIIIEDTVKMVKCCDSCQTSYESVVEPDPQFYQMVMSMPKTTIYDGLLVDITDECNLDCKICLHKGCDSGHYDAKRVISYCEQNKALQPFFLSGGEPTIHPEFLSLYKSISEVGGVGVITNGIEFTKIAFLEQFAALVDGDTLPIALSVHPECAVLFTICDHLRTLGKRLSAVFWVIDDLSIIDTIMDTFRCNSDVIDHVRIKAATNIWGTNCVERKIFVSDMLHYLEGKGYCVSIDTTKGNKPSVINITCDGLKLMLVSWYDVTNVDLEDIDCPPYYMCQNGNIRDFVSACLINERLDYEVV